MYRDRRCHQSTGLCGQREAEQVPGGREKKHVGPDGPGKRLSRSPAGRRANFLQELEVEMWGRSLLTGRAVSVECREPGGYQEGVRE